MAPTGLLFFWGIINALLFIPLLVTGSNRKHLNNVAPGGNLPSVKEVFQILLTFSLVCFTWIFFRAEDLPHALSYIAAIFQNIRIPVDWEYFDKITLLSLFVLLCFDWLSREKGFDGFVYAMQHSWQRRLTYAVVFFCIFLFGIFDKDSFIYFQF